MRPAPPPARPMSSNKQPNRPIHFTENNQMNLIETDYDLEMNAEQYRRFITDQPALTRAVGILRGLERLIARMEPHTVAALATARNPGMGLDEALSELADDLADDVETIAGFQSSVDDTLRSDREMLAPQVSEATARLFAQAKRSADLAGMLARGPASADAHRESLRRAGLDAVNLDRVAPAFDPAPMKAERAACDAEILMLESFLRTRDVALLPADFVVRDEFRAKALSRDELDNPFRLEPGHAARGRGLSHGPADHRRRRR